VASVGVCEDDPDLRSVLARALRAGGHEVSVARTGREALDSFPVLDPDVLILDIGLPDSDGRDVAMALRAGGLAAAVLFLTARSGIHDKVAGFEAGADDYLTKPFELPELLARVTALARRPVSGPSFGEVALDAAAHALRSNGAVVRLSPTEFRLLARLMMRPGEAVRRRELIGAGWPMGAQVSDNTLDTLVRRLRVKLDAVDRLGSRIETVRGVGYAWR
jgi:two-component system, OmpR family, response regulator